MPQFREGAVSRHKTRQHGTDQLRGLDRAFAGFAAKRISVSDQIAVNGGRKFDRQLDRLVGIVPSFSFAMIVASCAVGFENEVVRDYHAHWKFRTDGDRRLDVKRAADHLLAGLINALRHSLLNGLSERAIVVAAHAGLRSDAEQRGEDRRLEQHAPMVVDLVLEAGVAFGIGAGLALQNDRAAVRHDQTIPDQQRPGLTEGNLRVVLSDQARALRDQEDLARRTIVDVFRHLHGDLTGQVRA